MNDPLFSRLKLPERSREALYKIDFDLSHLQAMRNRLLNESPDMAGLPAFSVALDTFDLAFQQLIEQQEVESKS